MFKIFNLVVPGGSGNRYKDPRIEDYVKVRNVFFLRLDSGKHFYRSFLTKLKAVLTFHRYMGPIVVFNYIKDLN